MTAPPAVLPVPRPKTTKDYDQRTTEQAFQALERDLSEKYDRRSDLILDPGKELVLTADNSSAQYGIGIDNSGYLRILDYSDGTIGTFSVAWSNVDGAAQEITNLTTYVDAADATLQASITSNASTSATNGAAISVLQTEITAAREGEASLLANITDVRTAFASADAAEASARATLQANLEAADTTLRANIDAEESARVTADAAEASARSALQATLEAADSTLQANIDAEESARVTADTAEAAARTALEASLRTEMPRNNLIPARYHILEESDWVDDANFALLYNASFLGTGGQNPWTSTDAFKIATTAADGRIAFTPDIGDSYFSNLGDRANVALDSGKTYALKMNLYVAAGATNYTMFARGADDGALYTIASSTTVGTTTTLENTWSPSVTQEYSFELRILSASGVADNWIYRVQLVEAASGESAGDIPWIDSSYADQKTIAAALVREESARVTADAAEAAARTTLEATVAGNTASVSTNATAIADIEGNLTARYAIQVSGGGNNMALFSLETGTALGSQATLEATNFLINGNVLTTGTVQRTALSSAERDALGAEGVAANFYRQSSDPGSVPDGSWWADTGNSELNIRISSAWQKIADIGGDQFRASGTSYLTAEVSGSGSGTATTSAPSITVSGDVGTLTYLWRQKSTDALVSCSNTAIINPTFSRTMSAAPTSAVQTLWTLYITDATLGETIQWDVIVNFTNSF